MQFDNSRAGGVDKIFFVYHYIETPGSDLAAGTFQQGIVVEGKQIRSSQIERPSKNLLDECPVIL